MYVVCVTLHVKPEKIEDFKTATLHNASNTRKEPGNLRFDVLQGEDDPTRFFLYEVYHAKDDFEKHHQTAHYFRWKDAVAELTAGTRTATKNQTVFYGDAVA